MTDMVRRLNYRITREDAALRDGGPSVNEYLRRKNFSRHLMTYLRHHESCLKVNGNDVFTNYRLQESDHLELIFSDEVRSVGIIPVSMPLDIVYEDEDILVINKPAFLPIQPSLGHPERTLGNAVAAYYEEQHIPFVYRCVNRLDRNTSGLTIIAKNMASSAILYEQMKNRQIERTYFAIVHGRLNDGLGENFPGTIDLPIARRTVSMIERCVDFENGQKAVTHYMQIREKNKLIDDICPGNELSSVIWIPADGYRKEKDISTIALKLETGRTHQIRVHMSYIGHPLVGDTLYGENMSDMMIRQALHSWKLDFVHPISGEIMHMEAPIPEDMRAVL